MLITCPLQPPDDLARLARAVVGSVRPNRGDRFGRDDCLQTAYLAGLQARRSAERQRHATSSRVLMLAMQSAVFRMLHSVKDVCEADLLESSD